MIASWRDCWSAGSSWNPTSADPARRRAAARTEERGERIAAIHHGLRIFALFLFMAIMALRAVLDVMADRPLRPAGTSAARAEPPRHARRRGVAACASSGRDELTPADAPARTFSARPVYAVDAAAPLAKIGSYSDRPSLPPLPTHGAVECGWTARPARGALPHDGPCPRRRPPNTPSPDRRRDSAMSDPTRSRVAPALPPPLAERPPRCRTLASPACLFVRRSSPACSRRPVSPSPRSRRTRRRTCCSTAPARPTTRRTTRSPSPASASSSPGSATTRRPRRPATAWPWRCSTGPTRTTTRPAICCSRWPAPRTSPTIRSRTTTSACRSAARACTSWRLADAKPAEEAAERRDAAQQRFEEAARSSPRPLTALRGAAKEPAEATRNCPRIEWAARARCDLAEMQLRVGKTKEAQATADAVRRRSRLVQEPLPQPGPLLSTATPACCSRTTRRRRALSLLAPFADPLFGKHARYLLARTHHLADERAEAAATTRRRSPTTRRRRPRRSSCSSSRRSSRTTPRRRPPRGPVKARPPDHVARATFYLGVLHYEGGKFADAKAALRTSSLKQFPQSPLRAEADLRIGFCQVQLKQFAEAHQDA